MMTRIFSLCSLLFLINTLSAQVAQEALAISGSNYFLSARQSAMGGASGALTSEMGAIAVNPAILGTYETSELSFTPLYTYSESKSDYLSTVTKSFRGNFVLGNAGIVYNIHPRNTEKHFNIGFNYNRLNNFFSNSVIDGTLPLENSLWNELAGDMSGSDSSYIYWGRQQTRAGKMFVLLPDGSYAPRVAAGKNIVQNVPINTEGSVGEYALSFGTNFGEMISIGLSVVIRDAYMSSITNFDEEEQNNSTNYYRAQMLERTSGLGFGGKLGIIVTPLKDLNLGLAIQTPIFYALERTYEKRIITPGDYTSGQQRSKYNLMTPAQITVSASYNILGYVLLSADYEATPYAMSSISTTDGPSVDSANDELSEAKFGSALRFGAEVSIWQGLTARVGYGNKNGINGVIKSSYNLSAGVGYRFGEASVDLAYTYLTGKKSYRLYESAVDFVNNTITTNFINVSLSYRF